MRAMQVAIDEFDGLGTRKLVSRYWSVPRLRENDIQPRFELANDFEAHRHRETLSTGHP